MYHPPGISASKTKVAGCPTSNFSVPKLIFHFGGDTICASAKTENKSKIGKISFLNNGLDADIILNKMRRERVIGYLLKKKQLIIFLIL